MFLILKIDYFSNCSFATKETCWQKEWRNFSEVISFQKLSIFRSYLFSEVISFQKLSLFRSNLFSEVISFQKLSLFRSYLFSEVISFQKSSLFKQKKISSTVDFTSRNSVIIASNKRNRIARNSTQFRPTFLRLCLNFFIIFNLKLMAWNKCN